MQAVNAAVGNELAARMERGDNAATSSRSPDCRKRDVAWGRRRCVRWYGDRFLPLGDESSASTVLRFLRTFANVDASGGPSKRRDNDGLHLRVATVLPVGSKTLTVVTSEPFDKESSCEDRSRYGRNHDFCRGHQLEDAQPQGNKSGAQKAAAQAGASDKSIIEPRNSDQQGGGASVHLRPTFTVGTVPPAAGSIGPRNYVSDSASGGGLENRDAGAGWGFGAGADPAFGALRPSVCGAGRFCRGRGVHPARRSSFSSP